jgi:sec-independent protein translocase protein TatA
MQLLLSLPLFFNMRGAQLLIVVFVILLLFGGKKIPELMKGLGKGVHAFKEGIEEAKAEMDKPIETEKKPEDKGKDQD